MITWCWAKLWDQLVAMMPMSVLIALHSPSSSSWLVVGGRVPHSQDGPEFSQYFDVSSSALLSTGFLRPASEMSKPGWELTTRSRLHLQPSSPPMQTMFRSKTN